MRKLVLAPIVVAFSISLPWSIRTRPIDTIGAGRLCIYNVSSSSSKLSRYADYKRLMESYGSDINLATPVAPRATVNGEQISEKACGYIQAPKD